MPQGISKNPLTDISKVYLDKVSEARLKSLEKASVLDASDDPDAQDEARRIRVMHDYADLKKQQKKARKKAVAEENCDCDCGQDPCIECGESHHKVDEGFSDWRTDLREIVGSASPSTMTGPDKVSQEPGKSLHTTSDRNAQKVTEKKIKNKIKINPEFKEAVEAIGGQLLEVKEIVDPEPEVDGDPVDDKKAEQQKKKEQQLKKRIIRMKMMAVNSGNDQGIVASYDPLEAAVEYFYEEGINEEGLEQLVEEIGLDEFVNFIEGGTVELNEERAARRASVRAKKYDVVKKEVDAADAARRKSKKGEYSSAYKKKETDVTVYDNKVSKKKTVKKTVKKTETVKKPVTKKVVKAVAKVKKTQPAKKASKPGIRQKISTFYKRGVERHKKAREAGRVPEKRAKEFASGVKSGVKTAVKFAKDVKKVVSKEELEILEAERKLADRLARKRKVYDKTTKKAMQFARDEGEASGHARYRMSSISREMDGIKAKMKKEEVEVQEKVLDKFETGEKERIVKGMKKDSKGLKKRYGDKWKNVMYATATKRAKEAGDTSKSDKRYAHEEVQIEEKKKGLDGKACWKGYRLAGTKKKGGKTVDNCVKEDKALAMVKAAIIKKHGKGAIYDGKSKPKPPSDAEKAKASAERKKRQDADNKAYAGRAKKAGFKSTQDYTNVVARYGSEDNYKKGKGLGT